MKAFNPTLGTRMHKMHIHEQAHADRQRLAKLIEGLSVAMLTQWHDGQLRSRPMTVLELDGEGHFWFLSHLPAQEPPVSDAAPQAVNLHFADERRSVYVSMSGHLVWTTDRAKIASLWTRFARPWFPDGPDTPGLAAVAFVPENAEYWDSPHSRVVRLFAMAASMVGGQPVGLGEHHHLRLG